tara:strand:- start:499 stop:801 length:303 start_codon:yes stop_codon:yes gene_type:complete
VSDHIDDTNKIVSDTPRMDSVAGLASGIVDAAILAEGMELERAFNRACKMYKKLDIHALNLVDRIRRLEEAGDRMEKLLPEGSICDKAVNLWREAKEDKL